MRIFEHERFKGIYWVEFDDGTQKLSTVNLAPGQQVYGEHLVKDNNTEYRLWDPYRSKLAAAVFREIKEIPIHPGSKVLYLGAASGTTASHVSDIVGEKGRVYCIEISSRPFRDLLVVCSGRPNMIPIFADARRIDDYRPLISEIDVIYQDVAQPDQTEILSTNIQAFLREGGAMLALKARCIDVTKEPREIFQREMEKLEKQTDIMDVKFLDPYEKDHAMLVLRT